MDQDITRSFDRVHYTCCQSPPGSPLDPVQVLRTFCDNHPVEPQDPAFAFIHRNKLYVLTQAFLNKFIKLWVQKLGLDPIEYSCHSIRRGSACTMSQSGIDSGLIKSHGTWRSSAYQGYIDFTDSQKLSVTQAMYSTINHGCKK